MEIVTHLFDGLLCIVLLLVAWQSLTSSDLFRAIVLFIAFGLLMALVWGRLNAFDVAMAEAAIGAGLTGALLLAALAKYQTLSGIDKTDSDNIVDKQQKNQ
jgi:energy-converting hydrogenase B subunit D